MLDFDALNYDPDTPGFYVILLSTLFSFFLSSLIAITYQLTTKSIYRRAHFLQALVLISMVAAMIMQAIGDSVARGLGILGALSIIRFSHRTRRPPQHHLHVCVARGRHCGRSARLHRGADGDAHILPCRLHPVPLPAERQQRAHR